MKEIFFCLKAARYIIRDIYIITNVIVIWTSEARSPRIMGVFFI